MGEMAFSSGSQQPCAIADDRSDINMYEYKSDGVRSTSAAVGNFAEWNRAGNTFYRNLDLVNGLDVRVADSSEDTDQWRHHCGVGISNYQTTTHVVYPWMKRRHRYSGNTVVSP